MIPLETKGITGYVHPALHKAIVLVASCIIFAWSAHFHAHAFKMDNIAYFGGDEWHYHAVGANLSLGHGYSPDGWEDFSTYKFGIRPEERLAPSAQLKSHINSFTKRTGDPFWYPPGYPLFLGLLYALVGVQPIAAKIANLILTSLSAALLPVFGYSYGRRTGFLSGIIAAWIYVTAYTRNPNEIMTEPLFIFCLVLWTLFFMRWKKNPTRLNTGLLGLGFAWLFLIKGLTIFIPVFVIGVLAYKFGRTKKTIQLTGIFILGMLCILVPWNIFASVKSNQPVFVEGKTISILLDGNNEDVIETGGWKTAWNSTRAGDEYYLYNRLKKKGVAPIRMLLTFFWEYRSSLPKLFMNKIMNAFRFRNVYVFILSMLGYYALYFLYRLLKRKKGVTSAVLESEGMMIFPLMYFINLFIFTLIYFGHYRFTMAFMLFFLVPAVYFPLLLAKMIIGYCMEHRR